MVAPVTPAAEPPPVDEPTEGETPETWEAWLETQDEKVKALYTAHSEGLRNTIKATRDERDSFKKQIRDLAKAQAEGSETKAELEKLSAQLEETEKRAAFLEDAMKPELQCRNPRAAWLLARAEDLFDRRGTPDWSAIKAAAPELFGAPTANANAGRNTQSPPAPNQSMNAFIRKAAGRE